MAITRVPGEFFDAAHRQQLESFGFRNSLGSGATVPRGATAPMTSGAPIPRGMPMGGMERVPDASEVAHRARGGVVHKDAAQDRALIRKMMADKERSEQDLAHGGKVRLPRGMKPKVAQSHSPILSPNNTAPRKPQVTRTPVNEMPGGVMPYGTMPSREDGYEATSPTGATGALSVARGGRVKRADGGRASDDSGILNEAPQFRREGSVENRGIAARARTRADALGRRYLAGDKEVPDEGTIYVGHRLADDAERAAYQAENYPISNYAPHKDVPKYARGGKARK